MKIKTQKETIKINKKKRKIYKRNKQDNKNRAGLISNR